MTGPSTPESKDEANKLEIIGGVIVVAGIVVGGVLWWSGETFWNVFGQTLALLLAGGLVVLTGEGFRTGKLGIKGGSVYKDKNPFAFWIFVVFYIVVALVIIIISATLILGGG